MRAAQGKMLGMRLSWAAVSDPGLVRSANEDSLLAEPGWYVVADGMGGHDAGEVASAITVETLRDRAAMGVETQESGIPQALESAHRAVHRAAGRDRVIGSTVTGLALSAFAGVPTWLVFNVGDSRCYRVVGTELERITHDHTVVAELLASGAITAQQAAAHPDRHVITRAIGAKGPLRADYWMLQPVDGDRFVLCSDGLTNEVADAEILHAVASAGSPRSAAIGLLSMALDRGGRDNITVVVVFSEPALREPDAGDSELDDTAPRPAPDTPAPAQSTTSAHDTPEAPDDRTYTSADRHPTVISEVPA